MITIAKAEPNEYEEIDEVVRQTWLSTYVDDLVTQEDVLTFLNGKGVYDGIYIAKDENKIVGMIKIIEKDDHIYLKQLYILPEYQGQGIGLRLLNTIETDKKIYLQVSSSNTGAIRFYIKHGFVKMAKEDFFVINGKHIPVFIYCKQNK